MCLWAAANSLRGPVDPSDFKAYIFPLLFYMRVSDAWDDKHARVFANRGRCADGAGRWQPDRAAAWRHPRRIDKVDGLGYEAAD